MGKVMELHLKFLGIDSWDRPVYKDNKGILWKDVNPIVDSEANLCTSVGNEFDGEPDTGMDYLEEYQNVSVTFIPRRIIW